MSDKPPFAGLLREVPDVLALLQAGANLGSIRNDGTVDAVPFVVVPDGWKLEAVPKVTSAKTPQGNVDLTTASAFAAFFRDHAVETSRIYAFQASPTALPIFVGVLDEDAGRTGAAYGDYRFRIWRPRYVARFSPEWSFWSKSSGTRFSQVDFATLIEDGLPDIVQPSGAELMEMILQFEVAMSGNFSSTQRLSDGSHALTWHDDRQQAGTIKLPDTIRLSLSVYEGMPATEIEAKLRYRVKEGVLALFYELVRPTRVVAKAFTDLCAAIEADSAIEGNPRPLLMGTP